MRVLSRDRFRAVGAPGCHLGSIEVASQVTGYQRKAVASGEVLGTEALDLPPSQTRDPRRLVHGGAIRSVAGRGRTRRPGPGRCTQSSTQPSASSPCSRSAIGGTSGASRPLAKRTRSLPTIVIYDGYPGGAGIAELGYDAADRHLATTLEVIAGCGCSDGCPSCIQSPKCGNWNEPLDKTGAVALLLLLSSRARSRHSAASNIGDHSTRIVASPSRSTSPSSAPIEGTSVAA